MTSQPALIPGLPVNSDSDDDHAGEGHGGRDEEVVGLADHLVVYVIPEVLHNDGERYRDETRDEVGACQGQDEDGGGQLSGE